MKQSLSKRDRDTECEYWFFLIKLKNMSRLSGINSLNGISFFYFWMEAEILTFFISQLTQKPGSSGSSISVYFSAALIVN